MSNSENWLADFDADAERASHDLPDQIARARARFHQYRDVMQRLEGGEPLSERGPAE